MKKRQALIVSPETPLTYWSFKHAIKFAGKSAAFPPLGAMTVAAYFPKEEWDVRLVDENVRRLTDRDIRESDIALVSAMNVHERSAGKCLERCRELGTRSMIGGPITSTGSPVLSLSDYVVEGEVEGIMHQIVDDISRGRAKDYYKDGNFPDISNSPLPRMDLINHKNYSTMCLQFSRGCPFNCEFCGVTVMNGKNPRTTSSRRVIAALDQIYDLGWTNSIFITDDNFGGNMHAARQLLPEIIQWQEARGYPSRLFTQCSTNVPDDVLDMMARAGFDKLFLGIETPVRESLVGADKRQNTAKDLGEVVKNIQKRGIQVMSGFIMGFDQDPENVAELQERFIRENAIPLAMVGVLTAIPGTRLFKRYQSEGRLLNNGTGNNTDGQLNFIPKLNADKLKGDYRQLMRNLYSPREFYGRCLGYFERAHEAPVYGGGKLSFGEIVSFAKSVLHQGMLDSDRKEYWRYIITAHENYPERFAEAVTLGIMGQHFRKVTQKYLGNN